MKYCKSPADIPGKPHWAILEFGSITIPGDERSRTNPGHGYPEHTETTTTYIAFLDEQEWKAEIARRNLSEFYSLRSPFVALAATRARITTKTAVEIDYDRK
jgi:hypothetical protein